MGKLFGWLNRSYAETIEAYNTRMNRLPELHAGYVFFDWVNYDAATQSFSVYIEWNGELNRKLQDAMPQGGYAFRCSEEQAACYTRNHNGSPVYVKLHAKCGRLYVKHLYFNSADKQYELFFNGCDIIPPEMVCFWGRGPVEKLDYSSFLSQEPEYGAAGGAKELLRGSYRGHQGSFQGSRRGLRGSYRVGSYRGIFGSYRKLSGSYRGKGESNNNNNNNRNMSGSYRGIGGSYRSMSGSYRGLSGSYRSLFSSYRSLWSSFLGIGGSYRGISGSYRSLFGSYHGLFGSYRGMSGSYRSLFGSNQNNNRNMSGSYRGMGGSYRSISGSYRGINGSYLVFYDMNHIAAYIPEGDNMATYIPEGDNMAAYIPDEDNMVDGTLGYGLDLIW